MISHESRHPQAQLLSAGICETPTSYKLCQACWSIVVDCPQVVSLPSSPPVRHCPAASMQAFQIMKDTSCLEIPLNNLMSLRPKLRQLCSHLFSFQGQLTCIALTASKSHQHPQSGSYIAFWHAVVKSNTSVNQSMRMYMALCLGQSVCNHPRRSQSAGSWHCSSALNRDLSIPDSLVQVDLFSVKP